MILISPKDTGVQAWGDSLTESTSGSIPTDQRWPVLLNRMLGQHIGIYNGGVGGETAAQIAARFTGYVNDNKQIQIIWAGRNGVTTLTAAEIKDSIQSMVDHVGDERYIVLSVINKTDGTEDSGTDADKITGLNTLLQTTFPNNYLDVRTDLNDNSLRHDGLHLNAAGNEIVADLIYDFIISKGWIEV